MVLIACKLQHILQNPPHDHAMDMEALSDLADSFCVNEIRKRILQSRFCAVLCDTTSDQDTLLNGGGIVLPIGHMSLYVTFAPSMDDTLRTSLPKEVCIALRSHKALFYQGGLVLNVSSSTPLTPTALFQQALLTLLCLHYSEADSLSHPGGGHYLMVFVGQCASHKPHHDSLFLPGGYYRRDTTTLRGRSWRGNLSALLILHYLYRLSQSVPQRNPHGLER